MTEKTSVHPLIKERWSPRAFNAQLPESKDLTLLFESASLAASCYNEQPWRFIYATKNQENEYQKLLSCLVEFNQMWVKTAPVIILTLASKHFAKNGNSNAHGWHDVGLAMGNMSIQAMNIDLYMHQMAVFSADKAREVFQIQDQFDDVSMIALGYMGDSDQLPEDIRKMESSEREQRPLDKIIFTGDWKAME